MKDNIKEFIEFRTDEDGTYFYYNDKDNIEQWSYKLDELKDYITNLQKENERLKKDYGSLMQDNAYTLELEQENKVLLEKYSTIQILYNSSKLKNDKAIKYIKEHIRIDDEYPAYMEMLVEEKNELLNILQGGDK